MKIFTRTVALLFVLSITTFAEIPFDGIAAVVGDSVILASEVDAMVYMTVQKNGKKMPGKLELNILRNKMLDEMINDKVIVVHTAKDSNINITPVDIDMELNNRVAYLMKSNNLTKDELQKALMKEQGITLDVFKQQLRKQIESDMIKQKVMGFYTMGRTLSNSEIESFYEEYKDSLPQMGKSVYLLPVSVSIKPSKKVRETAYKKILHLKELLDDGDKFEDLAKSYSAGPNAKMGGDLGFISKGTLSELDFEEKVFSLSPGEISEPFETKLGFHIVEQLGRKDNSVHIRQIFVSTYPSKEFVDSLTLEMSKVSKSISNAKSVKSYCDSLKYVMGLKLTRHSEKWFTISSMKAKMKSEISGLSEGAVSSPVKMTDEIYIYGVLKVVDKRGLTLEDDWAEVSSIAARVYQQQKLIDLVKKWRKDIYIEKRL